MYIKKIKITNIRSIDHFVWELRESEPLAGWHVLIGDNGSGKTTVLRSAALALVGEREAAGLRQDWNEWLTRNQEYGEISLTLIPVEDILIEWENVKSSAFVSAGVVFERSTNTVELAASPKQQHWPPINPGWFSAAYGPFRRFTGGNPDYTRLFQSNPRLAAHLSVFGEDVALSEAIKWLQDLNYKHLENRAEGRLLDPIKKFINQPDFLPHNIRLQAISSTGVDFIDGNGNSVNVDNLSDGYRSILSMTFEIIRQLQIAYPDQPIVSEDATTISLPGVVLIDEVDAHLHPSWQRQVGQWFIKHFPQIQFIVTTHSPLVCQAAEKGSIWRLPAPGSDQKSYRVDRENPETAEEWKRLVYGNILEAYSTDLFGEDINRSPEAQAKYERAAELSAKDMDEPLSPTEVDELDRLMAELPATPYKHTLWSR